MSSLLESYERDQSIATEYICTNICLRIQKIAGNNIYLNGVKLTKFPKLYLLGYENIRRLIAV